MKRVLATIVFLVATIGIIANATALVGLWVARRLARDSVAALSTRVNSKLGMVDKALARVDSATSKLGDPVDQGSPLLTELIALSPTLAPKIAETRAQVAALHDGMMSVNAAL